MVSPEQQQQNARHTRAIIDEIADRIRQVPETEADREAVATALRASVRRYATDCLAWSEGERRLFFSDELFGVTREFAREARRFDPGIASEALSQALRNVWIMNSIQMMLGRPVTLTPAVFAYSLLYPYTDNPLDRPEPGASAKRARTGRLAARLRGERPEATDADEDRAFRLVGMVEDQYPRPTCPEVYSSLLGIHRAQTRSLAQQDGPGPYQADLVGTSLAKGGASVVADGYLVAGTLDEADTEFLFGYGAVLQLLDDLQDAVPDRQAGQMTLFSQTAVGWPLDGITARLLAFSHRVLAPTGAGWRDEPRKSLLAAFRRNCVHLLLHAVAEHPELFTRERVRELDAHSPVAFASVPALRRRVKKRRRSVEKAWRKQGVRQTVWELLDGEAEVSPRGPTHGEAGPARPGMPPPSPQRSPRRPT